MEDSKYYTPSIDEFFVGFEYEFHSDLDNAYISKSWHKNIYNFYKRYELDEAKDFLEEGIEANLIRVKYLDKSDIESCGFTTEFKDTDHPILYTKDIYNIIHYYNENLILIDNGIKRGFEGTIKNLSELRKLLKQIGIE